MFSILRQVLLIATLILPYTTADDTNTGNFTIINGQIYTPGLAILDAPQPYTPEGGDFLQIPLDISGDGRLPFPNNPSTSETVIHNITLYLFSYVTGYNFTISNATGTSSPLSNILNQEPSSTVKHVNWLWPSCLVGNGAPSTASNESARGEYNISIHQSFRLNGSEYYTIFDLPIYVTNEIPETPSSGAWGNDPAPGPNATSNSGTRIDCSALENPLLSYEIVNGSVSEPSVEPYIGGGVVTSGSSSSGSSSCSSSGSGLGTTSTATGSSSTATSTSSTGSDGNGISSSGASIFGHGGGWSMVLVGILGLVLGEVVFLVL